ncbi:DUF6401 family natural product biosynthesis protein [Dactylosporangium sp. NPDC000521]|uniref:DUF6401 family natural product biosynthesis protein n=1 Tax=Dactylosporangium sp. NPDC000521 TaxID=3363975 RepID=UPI0036948B17
MKRRTAVPTSDPTLARELLERLAARFGDAGLEAAAELPGLLAAVDQHAAAVRARVAAGPAMLLELASYADGLTDRAAELGWQAPDRAAAWHTAEPLTVRLLAVCAVYRWTAEADRASSSA